MNLNQQLEKLQLAMRQTKSKRLFERYQAVFLHLKGHTNVEIVAIIQRNRATVGIYINTYKNEGLTGLRMGVSTGKPPYLSREQQATLKETILTKIPADVGFIAKCNWTLSILVQWVKCKWNITYTNAGMFTLLKRLGFSHTRPTYTLEKADAEKQELFINETFPALKKNAT